MGMKAFKWSVFLAFAFLFPLKSHAKSAIETAGDFLALMPAYAAVYSLLLEDYEGCVQLGTAGLFTLGVVHGLKYAVGKPRPYQESWERGVSFPSGHTSSAFLGAAYIQRRYGLLPSLPAYAAAAFVAYSRVYAKQHDWVDVTVGAAFGILFGYLFVHPYKNKLFLSLGGDTKSVTASVHWVF